MTGSPAWAAPSPPPGSPTPGKNETEMYDETAARMDVERVTGIFFTDRPATRVPEWSGVAHDLRNLLQTATSAINIIERANDATTPRLRHAIDGARASIGHASELVARSLGDARPVGRSATSAQECLGEIAAVVGGAFDPAIEVDFVLDADLPDIACDKVQLQTALLNLIMNARDAIPHSGRISVRARAIGGGDAGGMVEISVADNGVGMSAQTIERAFELYFTTKAEGLGGIGLPMVEQFAASAGGSIAIASEPGTGTVANLRLPSAARGQLFPMEGQQ